MASIFTRIIKGEIPSYRIGENEYCYAFLDIHPLQKGHVLVVPKKEVNKLFDLDSDSYTELMSYSKRVAQAMAKVFPCDRVGMAVIGLEVPHAHIHLIPINKMSDMDFSRPKLQLRKEEFESIAKSIATQL